MGKHIDWECCANAPGWGLRFCISKELPGLWGILRSLCSLPSPRPLQTLPESLTAKSCMAGTWEVAEVHSPSNPAGKGAGLGQPGASSPRRVGGRTRRSPRLVGGPLPPSSTPAGTQQAEVEVRMMREMRDSAPARRDSLFLAKRCNEERF